MEFKDDRGFNEAKRLMARLEQVTLCGEGLAVAAARNFRRPLASAENPQVRFESALSLGDVWALDALWHELGFDRLGAVFRRARFTTAVEHAIRVMVFNRLCDSESKLGCAAWTR